MTRQLLAPKKVRKLAKQTGLDLVAAYAPGNTGHRLTLCARDKSVYWLYPREMEFYGLYPATNLYNVTTHFGHTFTYKDDLDFALRRICQSVDSKAENIKVELWQRSIIARLDLIAYTNAKSACLTYAVLYPGVYRAARTPAEHPDEERTL